MLPVGAGSSGAILANRLSANPAYQGITRLNQTNVPLIAFSINSKSVINYMGHPVLLLEAGGDPLITENIPFLSGLILNHPVRDWEYKTTPQNNSCKAYPNNVSPYHLTSL
jgi:choline dehydrogenase-like flavoprotein